VVWTYGGDPVALAIQEIVKRLDIPIVFALHNLAYRDLGAFRLGGLRGRAHGVCPAVLPGRKLGGLDCRKLPLVLDNGAGARGTYSSRGAVMKGITRSVMKGITRSVMSNGGAPDHFAKDAGSLQGPHPHLSQGARGPIGPAPLAKDAGKPARPSPLPFPGGEGTFVTVRQSRAAEGRAFLCADCERARPPPPGHPVTPRGRGGADGLPFAVSIDLGGLKNVTIMPNTPDPSKFYAVTPGAADAVADGTGGPRGHGSDE